MRVVYVCLCVRSLHPLREWRDWVEHEDETAARGSTMAMSGWVKAHFSGLSLPTCAFVDLLAAKLC